MKRLAGIATLLIVLAIATPVSAHVSVEPKTGAAGSTIDMSIAVPNERDVDTTKIEVSFDGASVSTADTPAHAGWSSSVDLGTAGVTRIVWERGAIPPGKSETFVATIKVPAAGATMNVKTLQTYADGQVVRWIDAPLTNGAEPEHPATVFTITGGAATTTSTAVATTTTTVSAPAEEKKNDSNGGLPLGQVFMTIGVVLVVLVVLRAKIKNKQKQ